VLLTAALASVAADEDFSRSRLDLKTAPRPAACAPVATTLPLELHRGDHVCLVGNTLFERAALFGDIPAVLHAAFPDKELVVRTLAWSADEVALAPRPDNFADVEQHLTFCKADVILAAYGFNESFAGPAGLPAFREKLAAFLDRLCGHAFNGSSAPRVVLVSPIANENVPGVAAADRNNANLAAYTAAMREVAAARGVAFVDVFEPTLALLADPATALSINGCHLSRAGYEAFAGILFRGLFGGEPRPVPPPLKAAVVDLERQFFRRYRPLNTFYYTGDRNKSYGYLDFLPAMRNFDLMCAARDQRIHDLAAGRPVEGTVDDSGLPPLPAVNETRGANEWLSAAEERKAFQVDPRFEVELFASEEEFPEIANPIQCRWDSRGRLWVSTSQAYPHVYPGAEPGDRLVILEDTDGDGKADTSKVFADDLHLPLSFEFGSGGVWVSEQPHLTFLADTDGDDRADVHEVVLSGFGTEDSHHSLHDFIWSPDGALMFRESIFHHSQVETPYGPVRQQNSGWFRYEPRTHRLTSFGTYPSTNPWGVAFDPWGNHVGSHPIFAEAFHSLDPPYPEQNPAPAGLQAYSGTCGQAFVDAPGFPAELQGGFVKARYKPTNRIEIHRWVEGDFGFTEEYVGDLLFSTNLSFIPVDLHFGPRGDLFIVDWYNPVKGHAQYSLRDSRRDRESGRIWRVTAKGQPAGPLPEIATASDDEVAALLAHRESRVRYLATRELAARDPAAAAEAIGRWLDVLAADDSARERKQVEAMWALSTVGVVRPELVATLAGSADHHVRAAAIRQLRFWYDALPDRHEILARAAADPAGLVRLEAAITASWIGTPEALVSLEEVLRRPLGGHLAYAAACAARSAPLARLWQADPASPIPALLKRMEKATAIKVPKPSKVEAAFDTQKNLATVEISCRPERMLFTRQEFTVRPGQPVKLVFTNPDATDHNLVIVTPGALAEVGVAANEMARDPKNASGDFVPASKQDKILAATPMIGPTRKALAHVLRFDAPAEPGVYPYVCTFPGHWIVMNGRMVVAADDTEAERLLAECRPQVVRPWTGDDFEAVAVPTDPAAVERGFHAFVKAQCSQCHVAAGHGVNLGPNLVETVKKRRGRELLEHILEPSREIGEGYRTVQFVLESGRVVSGVVTGETDESLRVTPNLLVPESVVTIPKSQIEERVPSRVSPMPAGLVNVLEREEILDLLAFLEAGENLPAGLQHGGPGHAAPASKPDPNAAAPAAARPPAATAAPSSRAAKTPPNVVVIFIDDLGYGDIGPFGATRQKTPNLDRMAAEGRRLTSFYAAPVCSVSRAQLLTGCYGPRIGTTGVYFPAGPEGLNPAEVTIAERLKPLGYATACIGKWHLGDQPEFLPTRQGFDRYLGIPYSNDMQRVAAATGERVVPLVRDENVAELLTDDAQREIVARYTDEAVTFIQESKDRPFFLYLPHTAVHLPLLPGKEFQGRTTNGAFGDWVEEVDWSVGKVLDALRGGGLDENTLVIFTSDNGPWVGPVKDFTSAGPLRGSKGSTWEGGVRVPTIARWPGRIPAGTSCDAVAGTIDLLPTLVSLAGGTVPAEPVIDGRDITGLLLGTDTESPREAHYYFSGNELQAVRHSRWKLAVAGQPEGMGRKGEKLPASPAAPRLYDLEADLGETTDVAAANPAVVERLRGLAARMAAELIDPKSPARRPPGRVENPTTLYPVRAQPKAPMPEGPKRKPAQATSISPREPAAAGEPARPNIVLFLTDDLGYGELGCYGNTAAITPNLDRFAAEGLKFTDCHSASSVCSPSRSSLLTGRTPYRNGVFTWIPENSPIHLRTSEVALPKLLRAAGYETCHVGKWHLNGRFNSPEQPQPDAHGYDWWLATQNNAAPSHAFPTNFVRNGEPIGRVDDYSAPFIAKEAVTWLTEKRDSKKPFFLAVWTHEPHYPIASAERYEKLHEAIADPEERTYRANVTQLDDAFGTVMKALAENGVADNTLVFFTSDNGPEGAGDKGPGRGLAGKLRGRKRSMYEGGHRVPGLVRWPGTIEPGTTSDLPVIGSDFFPTALAAAGVEPPQGVKLDGVNLLPALGGEPVERSGPLYWRWGGMVAYREGLWKIVVDEKLEKPELYNLTSDLAETTDLAQREPERLAAMMARLRASTAEIAAEAPDWPAGEKKRERKRKAAEAPTRPPNVLLICVDDLKPALGCYGDPAAKTPHLDRLAARGVRFEMAYCNQAVCSPSRNALLTGLRPGTLGIYDLATNFRRAAPEAVTLPQAFRAAGWRTEALGKIFHVGHGNGEDAASWEVPHFRPQAEQYLLPENQPPPDERPAAARRKSSDRPRGAATEMADVPDDAYADGKLAAEAVRRLEAAAADPDRRPFFLAVGFYKPHLPFVAPQRYWDLHAPAALPVGGLAGPPAGAPAYAPQYGGELRRYKGLPATGPIPAETARRLVHGYYAATSYMDACVGRVLDALDETGLADRTIVVLWGDHGWHLGDHGMWCKHTNYEQAARIPLVVAVPGGRPAATAALVESVDIYPTLCELAGVPVPAGLDGRSFAPTLADPAKPARGHALHVYPRDGRMGRAIRTPRHRLVEWRPTGEAAKTAAVEWELYDYEADPAETRNLAASDPATVAALGRLLADEPDPKPQCRPAGGPSAGNR
jgi:putative heme-binding domain-containing protein